MIRLVSLFIVLLSSVSVFAYIPPYWMIMSRVAETHGKGTYAIDQDVVFPGETEPLLVNEKWTVLNENKMRLEVTGRRQLQGKIKLIFIYDDSRKHFLDEAGMRKTGRAPTDFFEPLFHFRFSKNIKPYLVAQKVAPAESLRSEPFHYSIQKPQAAPESYVRLARLEGVVNWAVGTPSLPGAQSPGLWIEQDQFNVRQIRLADNVQVTARRYENFPQGLSFPRERDVQFNKTTVRIVTNSVSSVGSSKDALAKLEPQSLTKDVGGAVWPESQLIRAFYTQLR